MSAPIVSSHVASMIDGEYIESYFPRDDGTCDLVWQVEGLGDPEGRPRTYLMVHLTEIEARQVFDRDAASEGILEPVRARLTDPSAKVVQNFFEGGRDFGIAKFSIPSAGDEDSFLDQLFDVRPTTIAELEQQLSLLQADNHDLQRQTDELLGDPTTWLSPKRVLTLFRVRRRSRRRGREIKSLLGVKDQEVRAQKEGKRLLALSLA